ncbi:S1-C subfamily serine protease [Rhizomicrobium palustre]|uniref:S1-C subfamily serine protease n=1 Tax=Rhizomicrobium palustre TaxID=189966 RepID=A0A846MUA8_9PROT|nr:trypsin-like peptidase domain-containing protein [Rhizomicrobium palustre]NIK86943.1 S1-C subfamily serine protease [Rhizomicrobium palustre]
MTKSRSKQGGAVLGLLLLLGLTGCVGKSGVPLEGALPPDVDYAYIPLKRPSTLLPENDAGAVVLGDGVAVTAAHAAHMLPVALLIGSAHEYDLAFFHTDRDKAALAQAEPRLGAKVVAYAHYGPVLYKAEGKITALNALVLPFCEGCVEQKAFVFEGNAGPGYSGGPVIEVDSGKLIGILFGYRDLDNGTRLLYAYPMDRVREELKKIQAK